MRNVYDGASFFITNSTWTDRGSNPGVRSGCKSGIKV
jgi:hypothetical protein